MQLLIVIDNGCDYLKLIHVSKKGPWYQCVNRILFPISAAGNANFLVKVTDIEPPAGSGYDLEHTGYRLCGQYDGTPPMSAPSTVECVPGVVGRYVYIHVPAQSYLMMCEAEVFGTRKSQHILKWKYVIVLTKFSSLAALNSSFDEISINGWTGVFKTTTWNLKLSFWQYSQWWQFCQIGCFVLSTEMKKLFWSFFFITGSIGKCYFNNFHGS